MERDGRHLFGTDGARTANVERYLRTAALGPLSPT